MRMGTTGQIRYCEERIAEIDRTVSEIIRSGASSASLSSGSGSRSYTHLDLAALRAERTQWANALSKLRLANGTGIRHIGRRYR